MRAACALAVFHGVLLSAVCCGAEQFPYKAYLNANDVYVRSGPGKNYYPTDKLRRGAEVEVYRHDPGGWYAIRPPADSYSWISGGQLNILEDNLAEVAQPDVIAYVGSKFSDVHDVRQVKLEAGELVQIVGEKRFVTPDNGKAETWYKIEPPRGEFRWVFGRFVVPQGIAGTTAEHVDSDERPPAANRWSKSQGERGERGETSLARATHSEPAAAERQIPDQADPESVAIPAAAYQGSEQNIALTADSTAADVAPHNGLLYSTTRPATRRMSQIEKLDGELSLMVAEPPARWDFHSLRMRVQAAVDNAASALERGRAKDLLNDMGRYEQLQAGYAEIDAIRSQTDHQNQMVNVAATAAKPPRQPQTPAIVNPPGNTVAANIPLGNTPLGNIPPGNTALGNTAPVSLPPGNTPPVNIPPGNTAPVSIPLGNIPPGSSSVAQANWAAASPPADADLSQFDGVGQLRPVLSQRAGAPRFALTNTSGEVLMFLTASPGVNLDPYVGQYVGLTGKRGYMPKLQQAHLTVAQAQPLAATTLVAQQP